MKKIGIICILIRIMALPVFSQETPSKNSITKNEIGMNLWDLAILQAIGVSYERVGNTPLGFGITCRAFFGKTELYSWTEKYSIAPFLRYYFFTPKNWNGNGFYGEGTLNLFGGNYYTNHYDYYMYPYSCMPSTKKENFVDMAFCIGVGYKFLSKHGFYLDLNFGLGSPFGLAKDFPDEVIAKGGILFGYRF